MENLNKRQQLLSDAFISRDAINVSDSVRQYVARKFVTAADRGYKPGFDS